MWGGVQAVDPLGWDKGHLRCGGLHHSSTDFIFVTICHSVPHCISHLQDKRISTSLSCLRFLCLLNART